MKIFALADLHLAHSVDKPMTIFGDKWNNHTELIVKHWEASVSSEDIVLLPGDISWAKNLDEAKADLEYIERLPGKKILLRGNHDYWWSSLKKLEDYFAEHDLTSFSYLRNNAFCCDNFVIGGTRGWLLPYDEEFDEHDEKIFRRELIRMQLSINEMKKLQANSDKELCPIFAMHYPPISQAGQASKMSELLADEGIKLCVFGHIHHRVPCYLSSPLIDGVRYVLAAADQVKFKPVLLAEGGKLVDFSDHGNDSNCRSEDNFIEGSDNNA